MHAKDLNEAVGDSSLSPKAGFSTHEENHASPRLPALSPSVKQNDSAMQADDDDDDRLLADLTNLSISKSNAGDDKAKMAKEGNKDQQQKDGSREEVDATGLSHTEGGEGVFFFENKVVYQYFLDNVPVALELHELREKGWNSTEGYEYFKKQKWHTDNADRDTSRNFMNMMRIVADQMETATGIFTLSGSRQKILALGFAPGGFVEKALKLNQYAEAIGITLSNKLCGIPILVKDKRLYFHPADITLMAGDLGMLHDEIPPDHPDAKEFLPKLIRPRATFDLVTAEGGVLRPHQALLGSHRKQREAHRLMAAQLALALSRVKRGGRMIVLVHKPETWNSLSLFYTFNKFAQIQLFKPSQDDSRAPHQYKSSFYLLAMNIQSQSEAARTAVKQWTKEWRTAMFGTDDEYDEVVREHSLDVEQVLTEYGEEWIKLSMQVWEAQRDGLKAKSFTKD
ncbi:unnamed protein product [Discula destructiva]